MKREDSKIRILALERIFESKKPLTAQQIINRLHAWYGIVVERKTLYDDIACLVRFMNIQMFLRGRYTYYQLCDLEVDHDTV